MTETRTIVACSVHAWADGWEATPRESPLPFSCDFPRESAPPSGRGHGWVSLGYSCNLCRWAGPEGADNELADRLSADGGLR